MRQDELDAWCADVPGLERDEAGNWSAAADGRISYPDDGLAVLAGLEPHSYWFNHRNDVIASVVHRHAPPGTIFDIGGGNGYVSRGLVTAGFDCIVVEPDATGIAVARERQLRTIQAAFETLNIAPSTIPAFGLFDVLEHIEDEAGALARLYALLIPGGMAYITVPAYPLLWSWNDTHSGHFRRYTRRSLSRAMQRAGFTSLFSSYLFQFLVPPVFLLRALPSRFGAGQEDSTDTARQHTLPRSMAGRLIARSLAAERRRIEQGRSVLFGTSLVIAARKDKS